MYQIIRRIGELGVFQLKIATYVAQPNYLKMPRGKLQE